MQAVGGDDSDKENSISNGARAGDEQDQSPNQSQEEAERKKSQTSNGCARAESQGCAKCQERFEGVVRRLEPSLRFAEKGRGQRGTTSHQLNKKKQRDLTPLQISINVVDPDNNNLNVCLCSTEEDEVDQSQSFAVFEAENRICTRCRNIINQQPLEHRRALISQRLTIANDIIVNRIDSQYLNTAMGGGGGAAGATKGPGVPFEPYTPDSMESHSPMLLLNTASPSPSSSSFSSSSGSGGGSAGTTTAMKSSSVSSCEPLDASRGAESDVNLIETDEGSSGQCDEVKSTFAVNGGHVELKTMISVESAAAEEARGLNGNGVGGRDGVGFGSQAVNANQLKSRLERLQILSRMSKGGGGGGSGVNSRKSDQFGSGREEFENQMRRREEKKELKKRGKLSKVGGCCGQAEQWGEERREKSPCSVM